MLITNLFQYLKFQQIMVYCVPGIFKKGTKFKLIWGNFFMPSFDRDSHFHKFLFCFLKDSLNFGF